jgi:NAD(P)-dependent dehydrogenase (short-subunit alcohol dehydrogenase family)
VTQPVSPPDLTGRTALITGANSGIGKATATLLAGAGADVVITARDRDKGAAAARDITAEAAGRGTVTVSDLDLARMSSVRDCAQRFLGSHARLDVLILNAGMTSARRRVTDDGFEMLFQVNHLGHYLLTRLLLDRLEASTPSRVVVVASVAHQRGRLNFDDLHHELRYTGMGAYGASKLANVLFAQELARRLQGLSVLVNALHPGTVRSGWGDDGDAGFWLTLGLRIARPFFLSPRRAGLRVVQLATEADTTGGYYRRGRLTPPAPHARDPEAARRLWEVSEQLVTPWLP